jgi:hypothetical protein
MVRVNVLNPANAQIETVRAATKTDGCGALTGMAARVCNVLPSKSVCVAVRCWPGSSSYIDCCVAMMSSALPKISPRCDAKNSGVAACASCNGTLAFLQGSPYAPEFG